MRSFQGLVVLGVLLSQTCWAGPPGSADPICRFYAEIRDYEAHTRTAAGYRGQVVMQEGNRTLCLQDRTAVTRSRAEGRLVCSERFGAYDVLNIDAYGEFTIMLRELSPHGGFKLGPINIAP